MILLVTGGRDFSDYQAVCRALEMLPEISILIEGGALGADRLCRRWAKENGVHFATVPALWDTYFKAAGGRRNSAMLVLKPSHCVAFPGGTGTGDMVKKCKAAGVPVWEPYAK